MIGKIDHLHLVTLFSCIIRENPRKEELFIIGVGGHQTKIRLFAGLFPKLDPIGKIFPEGIDFQKADLRRKAKGDFPKGGAEQLR